MFKNTSGILCLSLLASMGGEVYAQSIENTVNSESQPNQEQNLDNDQNNAAVINQTGIYNIGSGSTYRIQGLGGRQAVCPRPSFILGTGYNSNDGINLVDNSSYSINAAIIFPLGGKLGKTCEGMANAIARKTQYDLEIINARSCAELLNAGVTLNPETFPTLFDVCEGVSLAKNDTNTAEKEISFNIEKAPKSKVNSEEFSKPNKLNPNNYLSLKDYLNAKNSKKFSKSNELNPKNNLSLKDYLNTKKGI